MLIRERDVRPTRVGRDQSDPLFATSWDTSPFAPRCGIEFALGRSATGQRLASSRRPLRWPFTRPPTNARRHGTCRNPSCFAALSSRSYGAATGSGRPTVSVCEGERRPLRPEVVPQLPVGVGPLRRRSPSTVTALPEVAAQVREGTGRGQRPVSAMSLSTHPALSPAICSFANKTGPAPRSLWVGLRVDSRGGSDAMRSKASTEAWSTRVPCGDVAPPSQQSAVGAWTLVTAWSRRSSRNVSSQCATVTALAPTRDPTGVLGRVKVPRASRAAATIGAATLTRPPRAQGMATIGASRNHERGRHKTPVVPSPIAA
jgi:hypothetical protein